jgi:glycosyltransferase involved in cell wall biosynthesis
VRRILLVTGLWPTEDQPTAGIFVKRRVAHGSFEIVAPRSYEGPMPGRYIALAVAAGTRRGRYQGVEAHPLFPAGLIGLLAARLRRIPLVVFAHGADVRETAGQNPLYRWLASRVVRGAARTVANSAETAGYIVALGGDPMVIPPGVDLTRFRPSPRPPERRVLYLGGDDVSKGVDIARLHADTLRGPRLAPVEPDDVPALIAAHDIVLVPSRAEAFGLVAAEAAAAGRWVVGRATGGLADVVEEGVTGTLVERDEDFAAAIAAVPDYDPDAIAARASRFSLEASNRALAELWEQVIREA